MDNYNRCDIVKMMGDLSSQSGDLYALWIKRFIAYVGGIDTVSVDIHAVDLIKLAESVNYAKVTKWLGSVKTQTPSRGRSSFQSARNAASIFWTHLYRRSSAHYRYPVQKMVSIRVHG